MPKLTARMQADQIELAHRIEHALPEDGLFEAQPGVFFRRIDRPNQRVHAVSDPCFCVIAQGTKNIHVGDDVFTYDPAHYLISTVALPLIGEVVECSPKEPYLSVRLSLDAAMVTSVMMESGLKPRAGQRLKAVDVSPLDANLLDAVLRLVRLADSPSEYRVLGPLVMREIIFRLLAGEQGGRLSHLATDTGHTPRLVNAVKKLTEQFDQPLNIESLARELGMSVSGFHAHFKALTALSPLQFQKQLRLQEARRLMLREHLDAAEAGFRVGYDDASHFNREYKRHFGDPPVRDVERLREIATTSAAIP